MLDKVTDHNFWREKTAEADSNRGPSAYQPNALPLGQTGSPSVTVVLCPDTTQATLTWQLLFTEDVPKNSKVTHKVTRQMQVPCRSRVETANARKGCAHSFPSLSFEQTYKSPSFICRLKLLVSPLLFVYFVFPQYSLQKLAFVFSFKQKLDRHCFSVIIYGVNTIFILPPPPPPFFFFFQCSFHATLEQWSMYP